MNNKLASRKFWITVGLIVPAHFFMGLDVISASEWQWVCGTVGGAYIGMQGWIDKTKANGQ